MDPLVSVIIPNYNHALYLDERIKSVLNQTYQNFEIIILDDVSKDNSKEVIEKYRVNPKVVKIVYNEENSGSTFKQWNRGFNLANGELIWIAESDDSCEPTLLEELIGGYKSNPGCSLIFCLSMTINSNGEMTGKQLKQKKNKMLDGSKFIKDYMTTGNYVSNASSAIFSKKAALEVDKAYMKYKGAGDRLFWIEIAEKGNVYIVNKQLNLFRRHDGVVTDKRMIDGTNVREAKITYEYLVDKGYLDSYILKMMVLSYFRNVCLKNIFQTESIRNDLLNLWEYRSYKKISTVLFVLLHKIWMHIIK